MNREIKDSGIKWIGKVPRNWEIHRFKNILQNRNLKNKPKVTDTILSLTKNRGVIPYSEKGDVGNRSKEDITKYNLAFPTDIVMNSMNVIIGSVNISKYTGAVSPVYYVFYPKNKNIDIYFYNMLFQTREFQNSLKGIGNGILEHRMRIPLNKLNNIRLPLPEYKEQLKIVEFLDKIIININNIITQTYHSIKELKKYKQSLITEAVTKGLDSTVEMKDSGVEWIGDIPKHWNINKIKYNTSTIDTKKDFVKDDIYIGLENVLSYEGRINDYGKLVKDSKEKYFEKGNILYSKLRPYLAKAFIADITGSCSGEFIVFESFKGNKRYLLYWLISQLFTDFINATSYGAKMPRSSWDYIKETSIPRPPKREENEIVSYLDDKLSQINKLIENKTKVIKELETYKNSLIYEYVTGKKEV